MKSCPGSECDHETGNPLAGLSGAQRARIIWAFFLVSLGVGPCNILFQYDSGPIPRYRGTVARWRTHFRGLAPAMHEISELAL
jgi:hypothetical protein